MKKPPPHPRVIDLDEAVEELEPNSSPFVAMFRRLLRDAPEAALELLQIMEVGNNLDEETALAFLDKLFAEIDTKRDGRVEIIESDSQPSYETMRRTMIETRRAFGWTYAKIGRELDLTASRVRQIHKGLA